MPSTAPAPTLTSSFTMCLMIPGKDLQILLQATEELKYNSFKDWCLVSSIYMFVCIQLALLWTADSFHVPCCLFCRGNKDWKSLAIYLKFLVSILVTFLLFKFVVKITWQCPASYDNVSISSLAWIHIQFRSSSSAYCCLKGISSKPKVFTSCLNFLPFSPSLLCLLVSFLAL